MAKSSLRRPVVAGLVIAALATGVLSGCTSDPAPQPTAAQTSTDETDETVTSTTDTQVPDGVEAVDLGLSVPWANLNVGAEAPEEYGTYFGWGEVTDTKTSQNDDDYPNADPPADISGTEYDVAHMNWGGGWQLPTREQAQELVDEATWTPSEQGGVAGYTVTGPNGNSIFLAAGGGRDGTEIYYDVVGADFWTGTRSDNAGEAWVFTYYQGRVHTDDLWRHYGFAVRPVLTGGAPQLSLDDPVSAIADSPAFAGFGARLLPVPGPDRDYSMPLSKVASTMPYHNDIRPQIVVDAVNALIDDANLGRRVFYDIYTPQQIADDAAKANTGLAFFRGAPGAPFAIISPGGGFAYVGGLHAGYPIAQQIAQAGLNAFVLTYRLGDEQRATEDLATAISYVLAHAEELQVDPAGYSLWGGSAGGMMVTNIVTKDPSYYGVQDLPAPAVQVLEYTTYIDYQANTRPLFSVVGGSDPLADADLMRTRVDAMLAAGIHVEFHVYPGLGHGFGRGDDTPAEGWVADAVDFWTGHR